MFFEACDLLIAELEDRFQNQHIPTVLSIEQALIKASNGDDFEGEVAHLRESYYKHDIDWSDLMRYLPMLQLGHYRERYICQASDFNHYCL